jgi:uncharacterized membrane protein YebE (DUF533 family)
LVAISFVRWLLAFFERAPYRGSSMVLGIFRAPKPHRSRAATDALSPGFALAVSMAYMVAADGHLTDEERHDLRKVVPDDDELNDALEYTRHTPTGEFLRQCTALLTDEQKLCVLLNLLDAAMVDGHVAEEEQLLLREFEESFGLSEDALEPFQRCLELKNARHIFR